MTCDCIYLVNGNDLEAAKSCADRIDKQAIFQREEVIPILICKAKKNFLICADYDGLTEPFEVKEGSWFILAYGKNYSMDRLEVDEQMGFPHMGLQPDFYSAFDDYAEKIEKYEC